MSNKQRQKLLLARQHREAQYDKAIQGVIDGTLPPDYATDRFKKLKAIKGTK